MLRLYLIPPGSTDLSKSEELLGLNNPPLNLDGVKHSEGISESLKSLILEAVISGPMKREFVTAKIIGSPHNLPVRIEKNLRDINYGSWSGKSFKALESEERQLMAKLKSSPGRFKFPSGEKIKKAGRRIREFTYHFKLNFGTGNIVIVVDDFISMILISQLTMNPFSNFEPWKSTEGKMSVLSMEDDVWKIESLRGKTLT